jgi:hypothetical protein
MASQELERKCLRLSLSNFDALIHPGCSSASACTTTGAVLDVASSPSSPPRSWNSLNALIRLPKSNVNRFSTLLQCCRDIPSGLGIIPGDLRFICVLIAGLSRFYSDRECVISAVR